MKTCTSDRVSHFETIKNELEEVRQSFIWLVYEISDNDWNRKIPGEVWTAKAEMVHIVQALEVLPKGIKRAVEGSGRSMLSIIPPGIRSWLNGYILIPIRSRRSTRKSIMEAYEIAYKKLVEILENLPEEDWGKGTSYPQQYRTIEQMAHRPREHFEEHAAYLRSKLGIRPEENRKSIE